MFDKKLSKLDDSYARLDLDMSQRLFNEAPLDDNKKEQQIIGDNEDKVCTRSTFKSQGQVALIFKIELKNINEALLDDGWVEAMKEELNQHIAI
ncbi:hypothetical protein CR513_09200, partial [Mucuna pruriens]